MPIVAAPGKVAVFQTLGTYPKVDLAITNPAQWNTECESLYAASPTLFHLNTLLSMARADREKRTSTGTSSDNLEKHGYTINCQTTCEFQARLGVKVIDAFVSDDFEIQWLRASVEERQHQGLANAGAQAESLNMTRAYCSDILRLNHLSRDGEVLLGMLREATPQDISIMPKEPYWFACSGWEETKKKFEGNPEVSEEERFDLMESWY